MVSHQFVYQLVLFALIWLFVIMHLSRPKRAVIAPDTTVLPEPIKPKRSHSNEPKPFEGLTQKPHCALCERETAHPQAPPPVPPAPMPSTHRRPREVDTSLHCCPHSGCDYGGWLGLGNLRVNGHPSCGPWRQFHCISCKGSVLHHAFTPVKSSPGLLHMCVAKQQACNSPRRRIFRAITRRVCRAHLPYRVQWPACLREHTTRNGPRHPACTQIIGSVGHSTHRPATLQPQVFQCG